MADQDFAAAMAGTAGRRLPEPALAHSRDLAREQLARLPAELRDLDCAEALRPEISPGLLRLVAEMSAAGD
jgi:hypothetical protein